MLRLSLLSFFVAFAAVASSQKCYGLDGTALDDTFAPCNSGATHSSCCATKRTTGSPDICLDTGLCMQTNNEYMGTLWQNGCTDSTGKDPACAKLCPQTTATSGGSPQSPSAWNLQVCEYGKFCCRAAGDQRSCCNSPFAPRVNTTTVGTFQTSTAVVSNTTLSSPIANTPSSLPSIQAQRTLDDDTCKKEKQTTAIVGGTLGSIFGTIILVLCYLIFWMHKRERRQRKLKEHYEAQFSQTNAYRKVVASTAESIRDSLFMEDVRLKTGGSD